MGGATIILSLSGTKQIFKIDQISFLFLKSYMTLKYLLIIDFPKFDPLTAAGIGLKCQSWAKMSKFPLVSD
jgi:hypothetical protein